MILGLCDDELAVSLKNLKEHCKGKSGRCCVFDQSADPAVRPSTELKPGRGKISSLNDRSLQGFQASSH
jgi:hypothetical protein